MLYLLDANVLITASREYYSFDQVPQYWAWLRCRCMEGHVKMPLEILDEVLAGPKSGDPLVDWLRDSEICNAIVLPEAADPKLVQQVVNSGYAVDLTEDEVEEIGRDPMLIAYALARKGRCVVTNEVSSPGKTRRHRKIPDVCKSLSVPCCEPFFFHRQLEFKTTWGPLAHVPD
jgi:hypothetical protein